MADLKPIGSEKLTGQEKLKRIMEIARYKETLSSNVNETNSTEFSINLSDGNDYQIVKEKQGYIIKKTISESQTEYIEPMKNRKYFSSYSQALKKLNLMAKELNRLNENEEGISMFGEQKKFVLKTPKPSEPEMSVPAPALPSEPPAVPAPELPPSPVSDEPSMPVGDEMEPSLGADEATPDMGPETEMGLDGGKGEEVTFKMIQKLTGKLTQKIREYESDKGLTSENIKYVINMVLSSLDLANLSEEDKEDVLSKFDSDEESDIPDTDLGVDDETGGEDITSDSEVEDIQSKMDVPVESEMEEANSGLGAIMDSIFGESKVDRVISKYFEMNDSEKKLQETKKRNQLVKQLSSIEKLSESIEQELSSKKFLEENKDFKLLGKTNKNNLVFENKKGQVKITPEGLVI